MISFYSPQINANKREIKITAMYCFYYLRVFAFIRGLIFQ